MRLPFSCSYAEIKAPKKGVSAEEKRIRMQQIFFERAEVLTLKELEKIAPKEKGIGQTERNSATKYSFLIHFTAVVQSVKDVLQSLVDDGLVETDKIGAGNFYWALPSKAGQQVSTKCIHGGSQMSGYIFPTASLALALCLSLSFSYTHTLTYTLSLSFSFLFLSLRSSPFALPLLVSSFLLRCRRDGRKSIRWSQVSQ